MADLAWGLLWPPCYALLYCSVSRIFGGRPDAVKFWEQWFFGGFGIICGSLLAADMLGLAIGIITTVFGAVMWWLSRRRKKRAPKTAGAKSRARVAALVKTLRESLKPGPVLRPVPQGASLW